MKVGIIKSNIYPISHGKRIMFGIYKTFSLLFVIFVCDFISTPNQMLLMMCNNGGLMVLVKRRASYLNRSIFSILKLLILLLFFIMRVFFITYVPNHSGGQHFSNTIIRMQNSLMLFCFI